MRPLLRAKTRIKPYIKHETLFEPAFRVQAEFKQRDGCWPSSCSVKLHMLGETPRAHDLLACARGAQCFLTP